MLLHSITICSYSKGRASYFLWGPHYFYTYPPPFFLSHQTLSPALMCVSSTSICQVWPVSVKVKGLGRSKSLAGESRLCLTATSLILIRVGPGANLPSVTIPLLSVRRFGHLDGSFFLELGRSAPHGPGEIWLDARDQGS